MNPSNLALKNVGKKSPPNQTKKKTPKKSTKIQIFLLSFDFEDIAILYSIHLVGKKKSFMATLNHNQRYYFFSFSLIIFYFQTLIAEPISSFSLQTFNTDQNPNFDSDFDLLGDAQIANEGKFVNLTTPSSGSSSGQIVYKKPFKFVDSGKPIISFSTDFTFAITSENGDGIAFVIFPSGGELSQVFDQGYFGFSEKIDRKFVAVEYDTRKNDNVSDLNANHVGIDVGSFVSSDSSDVSSIGLMLNGGVPLKSWIDYEASSKRLEVRLAESGNERPNQPLISYYIDFSEMWGDKEILVGISSSNGNSRQVSSLSSWSFSVRSVPSSLHSQPLDPQGNVVDEQHPVRRHKNSFLTVLGALIFATGCGTLVAFVALFFWVVFFGRHANVAPELPLNPMEFKYEKVNVTVDNASDDATN